MVAIDPGTVVVGDGNAQMEYQSRQQSGRYEIRCVCPYCDCSTRWIAPVAGGVEPTAMEHEDDCVFLAQLEKLRAG